MRIFKTPGLIQALLPGLTWCQPGRAKTIYLTFDDGPIPEVTEFVLEELARYQATATFFCVGDNIRKYPTIAQKVVAAGHTLANHTHNHLKGWQTPTPEYIANVQLCEEALLNIGASKKNKLFRPPYGRVTRAQFRVLRLEYQVIMWDVLTYDFDNGLSEEACLRHAIKNTKAGSIVVFHDSLKACRNLQYTLPRYLAHYAALGFQFQPL